MPTIITVRGYRLFFWSNEGRPREPLHVHVQKGGARAKVWLEPAIVIAEAYDFNAGELRDIEEIVAEHVELIRSRWDEHFSN